MTELETYQRATKEWRKRWKAVTDKLHKHIEANRKIKIENAEFKKSRPIVDFLNVCSFCGHAKDDIDGLIVGPYVSICFNCIETAKLVVKREKHGPGSDTCTCGYKNIRTRINKKCPHHSGSKREK